MFASAGYFRGLNCPYFGSGLCERPYCHFRHVKDSGGKSDEKSGTGHVGTVDGPPTGPTSKIIRTEPVSDDFGFQKSVTSQKTDSVEYNKYTGEPVKCVEQGVNKYTGEVTGANGNTYRGLESLGKDERSLNGIKFNKYTGEPITGSPKIEQYSAEYVVSSPVIEINKYTGKPVYGKKVPESVHTKQGSKYGSNMPSYNPTPLTELKKRPMNKYILASSADNGEEEYDPESNYSTLSTSGYKNNQPQLKRAHSYDPSDPSFDVVSKKSKGDFQFDISEFSDDDNDEETEEKSRFGEDFEDKDDGFQVKDVQFFEDLLDKKESNEIDEEPGKYFFSSNSEKTESSTSLISKFNSVNNKIQKPSKAFQRSISEKASKEKDSIKGNLKNFKRSFSTKSASDEKGDSKKSKEKHKVDNLKEKIRSKDKILHENHKSDSANGHKSSSKLTSSSSKSSDHHKSSSSNHKSSSSTHKSSDTQKSASDNHKSSSSSSHRSSSDSSKSSSHKSSSESHKSLSSSQKSSSSHKSSSSSNHKSSSSNHKSSSDHHKSSTSTSSHSGHKSDKENSVKNHEHSKSKRTSSENDSHSKHKERKSSSEDQERRKSVEENAKKKIINLNVDLFGEDSDLEEETEHHNGDIGYSSDSSHGDFISVGSDIELSDNDTYEECFRIFKEGHSRSKDQKKKVAKKKKKFDEDGESGTPTITAKKRKAHAADIEIRRKLGTDKPVSKLSPAQVMHNRFLQIQQKALKEAAVAAASQAAATKKEAASSSSLSSSLPSCSIVKGKKSSEPRTSTSASSSSSKSSEPSKFVMTTVSKNEKRKAHVPDVIKTNLKRPTIPSEFGSKVPVNIRQRYLNLVIDECLKLCSNEEDAYKRGQDEEQAVYQRSNTKKVYLNVVINTIKKLRTEISQKSSSKPKKTKISPLKIAHEAILGGKSATKTTFTLNRSGGGAKVITENFKGVELFNRLSKYVLTEQQLKDNGFPFPSPDTPGSAIYYTEKGVQMSQKTASHNPIDYEKVCVRCGKRFIVYPNGKYANEEECTYHWGKAWKKRVAGVVDTRYTCCQGDFNSEGCQFAKVHVHETNKFENLSGYMKTIPCSPPPDGDYGIFAMDCEMVYTLAGVELARVTVVDASNEPIYETLVKPDRKILDYNTKFSGITEEDMKGVTTSIRDVQAVLLSLLTDNTILIGHSLESDLNAVKLIHKTVVDTSVVFPHRLGPPYKRALKTLMAEYMQKIIQDDVGGHDSLEDAVSCMDLMHYKVREDARFAKRS